MSITRRIVHSIIRLLVANNVTWPLLKHTVMRAGLVLLKHRKYHETGTTPVNVLSASNLLSPSLSVLNGPFRGMRYPRREACGSALFPKLLGSYEREIHKWIETADSRRFSAIVVVGCAEGYYAVGLARRWPWATVHAFDINQRARQLCSEMAVENNVNDRVTVHAECNAKILAELNLPTPSLIISDCEGFELSLFSEELIARMQQHDFLIELHDYYDMTISTTLKSRFSKSHMLESAYSIDDLQKVHLYEYPELAQWNLQQRRVLLTELRPYVMEWIYCRSRSRASM